MSEMSEQEERLIRQQEELLAAVGTMGENVKCEVDALGKLIQDFVSTPESALAKRIFLDDTTGTVRLLWRSTKTEMRLISKNDQWEELLPLVSHRIGMLVDILLNRLSRACCVSTADQIRARLK